MTIVLAALVTVLALGYLPAGWLVLRYLRERDQSDRLERAAIQGQHEGTVRMLNERIEAAHTSRAGEIADLLQRIQAPEVAVIQHGGDTTPVQTVLPLSDEEAAERAQAIARIEELERTGFAIPEVIG